MGPTNVYAIMAFLIICGMRLLFSLHGSWRRRLLVLLSTITGCGLQYIHFFLQILSPLLGNPVFSFLKFLLLAICPVEWGLRKQPYRPRPFWWGFGLWRGLIWSEYPISMSSSLKMILFVSYKKALSTLASANKHSTPALEAMLTKAFVAILRSFNVNSNWSNRFLNMELFCKVVIAATSKADLSFSSSLEFAQMTTAATPFPLWFRNGFLWTSS